jgi:hypothetical protein
MSVGDDVKYIHLNYICLATTQVLVSCNDCIQSSYTVNTYSVVMYNEDSLLVERILHEEHLTM